MTTPVKRFAAKRLTAREFQRWVVSVQLGHRRPPGRQGEPFGSSWRLSHFRCAEAASHGARSAIWDSRPARRRTRRALRRTGLPASSASTKAFSSTTGPRAVLMRTAVGFITASSATPTRWRVDSFKGTCKLTMSDRSSKSASVGTYPLRPVSCRDVWMTSMSKPDARCATACPMRPKPTSPSVVPSRIREQEARAEPPASPATFSQVLFGTRRQPGGRQDEEKCEVRRRVIEDARGAAHRDAQRCGRFHINVVVTHRCVCHSGAAPPLRLEDRRVHWISQVANDPIELRCQGHQPVRCERPRSRRALRSRGPPREVGRSRPVSGGV